MKWKEKKEKKNEITTLTNLGKYKQTETMNKKITKATITYPWHLFLVLAIIFFFRFEGARHLCTHGFLLYKRLF